MAEKATGPRTWRWTAGGAFAALFMASLLLASPTAALADEAALKAALSDYQSGLTQRGHDRLKAYLATNPPDEEFRPWTRQMVGRVGSLGRYEARARIP